MWGTRKYQVALKTRVRTYRDSLNKSSRRVLSFLFTFSVSPGSIPDSRTFRTEERRRLFLAESFTQLSMEEIPESNLQWKRLSFPLQSVVSHKLTAVSSVMDYQELEFPPYGFLIYNWPNLWIDGRAIRFADAGYRDCLYAFVGKQVSGIDE